MANGIVTRYHPLLVVLHWLIAALVILGLVLGPIMAEMPLEQKIQPLRVHMAMNIAVGVLILVRLLVRFTTRKPPPATTGNAWLDRLRLSVHVLLYIAVLSMVSTGLGMAAMGDLLDVVYGGAGFPPDFNFHELAPRAGHGFFAAVLMVLIGLHIAGALYHHFVLKDRLLARMWFGRRTP